MRYRHILAATDFSDLGNLAVRSAAELAVAHGARLTLVHVLPEPRAPSPLVARYYDVRTDKERLVEARLSAEQALRAQVPDEASTLSIACEIRLGDPAEEILGVEARAHPDLVVVATKGRHGVSRWVMGSVASRVVSYATVDVLVVRAR